MIHVKDGSTDISFTPQLRDDLRSAYEKAQKTNDETFEWQGHLLVTSYAKYLLEFLDLQFPGRLQ